MYFSNDYFDDQFVRWWLFVQFGDQLLNFYCGDWAGDGEQNMELSTESANPMCRIERSSVRNWRMEKGLKVEK